MRATPLTLLLAALSLPALAASDPSPAFVELSLQSPQGGLRDQVGSDLGSTIRFG